MNAAATLNIASKKIRLFGETRTMFQLCRGNDVISIFETRAEAEAAMAGKQ